ncbi:cell division topological specificity factor [Clostridium sp. CAG:768]|nr:cell division topological specificity factor [Clostridium sp. CAG:768]
MLLQNLYNKVIGFFRQTDIEQETESAKETACNRLRVVLMQDRTNLTPELMERMRREMVDLLSKYVEMDKDALELNLEQDGDQVALMLSIPVIRAKDEDEIKAALEAEDKQKESDENEELTEEEKILNEDTEEKSENDADYVDDDEEESDNNKDDDDDDDE